MRTHHDRGPNDTRDESPDDEWKTRVRDWLNGDDDFDGGDDVDWDSVDVDRFDDEAFVDDPFRDDAMGVHVELGLGSPPRHGVSNERRKGRKRRKNRRGSRGQR